MILSCAFGPACFGKRTEPHPGRMIRPRVGLIREDLAVARVDIDGLERFEELGAELARVMTPKEW
jgi:hypothetical protein